MYSKLTVGATALLAGFVVAACGSGGGSSAASSSSSAASSASAPTAMTAAASRSATFQGANGKKVTGKVDVTGGTVVLSNFSSDEGPDLHLYLANGSGERDVAAGKLLGPVVFDKSMQTFPLDGVDAGTYTTVVVHCDKAKATFGAATLS
jgi:hypothetical protein